MPKFIDKTGMTFGQLTVLSRAENKGKSVYQNCKCSCGKEICVRGDRLTKSKVDEKGNPSCGHLRIEHVKESTSKNLINQKFGRLTVIEKTNKIYSNGSCIQKCRCDCGNIINIPTDSLTKKDRPTRSCGCLQKDMASIYMKTKYNKEQELNKDNIINNFKILTSELRPTNNNKNETWIYAICPFCNNKKQLQLRYIKNGDTKSCGCIIKSNGEEKIKKILLENKIPFEQEYRFKDCRFKNPLPFDFFINNKYLIEYDGEQHFNKNNNQHDNNLEKRDSIKNQYCKNNNIPLIRIPYTRYDKLCLEDLLLETSQFII